MAEGCTLWTTPLCFKSSRGNSKIFDLLFWLRTKRLKQQIRNRKVWPKKKNKTNRRKDAFGIRIWLPLVTCQSKKHNIYGCCEPTKAFIGISAKLVAISIVNTENVASPVDYKRPFSATYILPDIHWTLQWQVSRWLIVHLMASWTSKWM